MFPILRLKITGSILRLLPYVNCVLDNDLFDINLVQKTTKRFTLTYGMHQCVAKTKSISNLVCIGDLIYAQFS
ncbi:unnamed protein product [Rotaria sp. Silwood1]|nr:unnamed protein product [Rotaria sp. Silwood1]CAF1361745.1 unnamed protein product [Rotaria sp. Silwood1]CAF3594547.1 unnamed protein product [Rotaria sp. Silwood1]